MTRAHVTYVLDAGFLHCTLVSLYSLLRHRPEDVTARLFFTAPIPAAEAPLAALRAAFPGAEIVAGEEKALDHGFAAGGHVSPATLARLYLPKLLDRKTLYLDGDTMVRRDIGPLFEADLGGQPIAAVRDPGIQKALWYERQQMARISRKSRKHLSDMKKIAHLVDLADYFNAGVILFDLPRIREAGFAAKMMDIEGAVALRREYQLRFNDQNWLNHVFRGAVHWLGPEWNTFWGNNLTRRRPFPPTARAAYAASRADPAIIHYVGRTKPWKVRFPWLHRKREPWISEYKRVEADYLRLVAAAP